MSFHGTKLLPLPRPPFGLLSLGRALHICWSRTCGDFAGSGFRAVFLLDVVSRSARLLTTSCVFFSGVDFSRTVFAVTRGLSAPPTVRPLLRLMTVFAGSFGCAGFGPVVPVPPSCGPEGVGGDMSTALPGLDPLSVLIEIGVPSRVWLWPAQRSTGADAT